MSIAQFIPRVRKEYQSANESLQISSYGGDQQTADIQLQRFKIVWKDCVEDVPYYAELVEKGLAPREIKCWEDVYTIPELTRSHLQDHPQKFRRISGAPDFHRMTGGSTGNPVQFGVWNSEERVSKILKLKLWIRAGYELDSKLFLIWGHSHLLGTGWRRHLREFQRKSKDRLLGYRRMDAYHLSPDICRSMAREFLSFRPVGFIGYASALDYFVRSTPDFAENFAKCGCRFVQPCSELPPKPDSRDLLRQTFHCKLIEEFGGVDFGQVAMRFEDDPFEVFSDHYFVETQKTSSGSSEEEAVLVSALYPRYTPLVRYRQGDAIEKVEKLSNGHVIRFGQLVGRCHDMVALNSGSSVHSMAFFHCIHQEASVLNIQLVLEDKGTRLRLVTNSSFNQATEERIRQRLGQVAPELAECIFEQVDDVETSRAGKRRWVMDNRSKPQNKGN